MTQLEILKPLTSLHEEHRKCTQCGLRSGCNQVIPGVGPRNAALMLVGEAPGADEDLEGVPFFGKCGKFLTKLLLQAKIERMDCYITNTVGCRPPKNRKPTDEEIQACKSWLWQKIKLVNPKVIITLGATPTRLLLGLKKSFKLGEYVGRENKVSYINSIILPAYHPSFLLQHGRKFEEDTVKLFEGAKCLIGSNEN